LYILWKYLLSKYHAMYQTYASRKGIIWTLYSNNFVSRQHKYSSIIMSHKSICILQGLSAWLINCNHTPERTSETTQTLALQQKYWEENSGGTFAVYIFCSWKLNFDSYKIEMLIVSYMDAALVISVSRSSTKTTPRFFPY